MFELTIIIRYIMYRIDSNDTIENLKKSLYLPTTVGLLNFIFIVGAMNLNLAILLFSKYEWNIFDFYTLQV